MGVILVPILRLIAWLFYFQPRWMRSVWSALLGSVLATAGLRRKVILQNLEFAYPNDMTARARLARQAYDHLAKLVLEILLLFGPMRRFALQESRLEGLEHWKAAKAKGKGVIFLSSHVGNWEVMAATGALHGGMDLMLVTKHLKPEWFHEAIEQGRKACGVLATYEPRTLRDVLAHLKKNGTVGFVQDQYAGPPVGIRVPVFGIPVGTTSAIATLAKRTGATVLPVVNYRRPDSSWVVEIRAPLEWEPHEDPSYEIAANTARYSLLLEKDIQAHPEQWLWTHRRFKGDLSPLREDEWKQGRRAEKGP